MHARPPRDKRLIAALLVVLMSTMVALGSTASPPVVSIGSISNIDDGTVIVILGAVVDLSARDDGSEGLVLADMASGSTIRVHCDPGTGSPPSQYASIGDELRVEGEISRLGQSSMLFTSSGGVSLVKGSVSVLTIEVLSKNWALFVGDRIRIGGVVVPSSAPGCYRLADDGLERTIALSSEAGDLGSLVGKVVTLEAFLRLLPETMMLALTVVSFSPGRG